MVGFDIGFGLAVEGLSPPRLEKGRSDVHMLIPDEVGH